MLSLKKLWANCKSTFNGIKSIRNNVIDTVDLNRFATISIRGRVAFGICCLNTFLKASRLDKLDWQVLLDKLWSYTNLEYLDHWHMELAEYIPFSVIDQQYDQDDFKYISIETLPN